MTTKQKIYNFARERQSRIENARKEFFNYCLEKGFNATEINIIIRVYKQANALKFNGSTGNFDVTHGGFLGKVAMNRALKIGRRDSI
jgi:hypothetical protein